MTPVVVEELAAGGPAHRRVALGPIALPTLMGELKETLGDQLEAVGAGVVAGERRPRPFNVKIPIHGDRADTDRFEMGMRLRRQIRALMENSEARLQGLYLAFDPDNELDGWLLVGGGDLSYAQGSIGLADFELELTDCYRVAGLRTHRPALRLIALDRRLPTTPRDVLGTVFSEDFQAAGASARHFLPVGVTDTARGSTRSPVALAVIATRDGNIGAVDDMPDGEIIDFEQSALDQYNATVVIRDTHGSVSEADWEPVYGLDQPLLTAVPTVLENVLCRVRPDISGRLDVQSWDGEWSTDATVMPPAGMTASTANVLQWTPERAVIRITGLAGSPPARIEIFVTLQRGWTAPRVECYATGPAGPVTAALSVYARTAGDATLQRSSATTPIIDGTAIGAFTVAPWALLLGPGTDRAVHIAVVQEALALTGSTQDGREGVTAQAAGYVSLGLGLGPRASGATDAAVHAQRGLIDARAVPELVARS